MDTETPQSAGSALHSVRPGPDAALLVVDVQVDFCPGGALAVPEGDAVIDPINRIMPLFGYVVASRDHHPPDHCSFREQGGPWPRHCVQDTPGAELHPRLHRHRLHQVVQKATEIDRENFSAFAGSGLAAHLRNRGIRHLYVGGLATEYCVLTNVLDALQEGFSVTLLVDCTRSVNVNPAGSFEMGDGERAIRQMVDAGALLLSSHRLG
jgi:nicotinamidase/pyrazinamidase